MTFTLHRTLYYPWLALFGTLLAGFVIWIVGSILQDPGHPEDGMGAFPSPLLLIIMASLVAFVITFVAAFFRTKGWALFVASVLVVVVIVVIWLLDWVLGTWGTVIILLAIPAVLGVVIGLVLFLLIVKRSEAGIYLTAVLFMATTVLLWTSSELGSITLFLAIFLFDVAVLATVVGYKSLITVYTVFKKWSLGA